MYERENEKHIRKTPVMTLLIIITAISLILSTVFDVKKTISGIKKGLLLFIKILPTILSVIIIVSIVLYLIPQELLLKYFGKDTGILGYLMAAIIGSVSLIPGFIAYPIAGLLIKNGVSYSIIAIFITTLMMVGVLTIPIERKYFGLKITLIRNFLSFIGALIIGVLIGFIWNII
jgi:uncharacterized membrane protein YraQ (UPF0718 family)